jgi:chromosome segregation ATPase
MANSFWFPDAKHLANQAEPVNITRDEPEDMTESDRSGALTVSADDFDALEDRIYRAVELVKQGRQHGASTEARISDFEARAVRAEAQLQAQALVLEQLENEVQALREEREQVRQRMERVLKQLDALEM